MATTLAACELSGYSNNNQTFLWFSFEGKGFSSSLIKPSSSLAVREGKEKEKHCINLKPFGFGHPFFDYFFCFVFFFRSFRLQA